VPSQQEQTMPGEAWRRILKRESLEMFASAFVRDPTLVASVANAPIYGAAAIRTFFSTTAAIYEDIAFTKETAVRQTTFLEWKGTALGHTTIEGITVLVRDEAGQIERIELYHRPLSIVVAFSDELQRRLGDTLGAQLFCTLRARGSDRN
jgi:hypothetical protein